MAAKTFTNRLLVRQAESSSLLCVGLDPDITRIPEHLADAKGVQSTIVEFNRQIIDATAPYACAFKLNLAFYEAHGVAGWAALERTMALIPEGVMTIADGKRGDIGNTARFYAASLFDTLEFDACTVAPYMGTDAVAPFLERADKCAIVLCRTSNPSGDDFQLNGSSSPNGEPLFESVARRATQWDAEFPGQVGLVVGATRPTDLKRVRTIAAELPILLPGVGAQGGSPAETVRSGRTKTGPILVNSSRSILYAGSGLDFAEEAARAADDLRKQLNNAIEASA